MYRLLKHITIAVLGLLFLVSSSGVYLTVHYCSLKETTDLFFFKPLTEEPCEHHAHDLNEPGCCNRDYNAKLAEPFCSSGSTRDRDNCAAPSETPECCSNTVFYIAVEDHFVKTDHPAIEADGLIIHADISGQVAYKTATCNQAGPNSYKDPPSKPPGRQLALLNRVLIL